MPLHEETIEAKQARGVRFLALLDALRIQYDISKYKVCQRTGITWNTLWTWTSVPPKAYPSVKSLKKVEKFYNKTVIAFNRAEMRRRKKGSTPPNGSVKRAR